MNTNSTNGASSAIATALPEDVSAAHDGIRAFAEQEILPRHAENQALFHRCGPQNRLMLYALAIRR